MRQDTRLWSSASNSCDDTIDLITRQHYSYRVHLSILACHNRRGTEEGQKRQKENNSIRSHE